MLARARLEGTGGRLARVCGTLDCLRPSPAFDLVTAIDDVVAYVGAQDGGARRVPRGAPGTASGRVASSCSTSSRRPAAGATRSATRGRWRAGASRPTAAGGSTRRPAPSRSTSRSRRRSHVARERHVMRLYTVAEVEAALRRHGFDVVVVTDLYDGAGVSFQADQPSYDVLARRR